MIRKHVCTSLLLIATAVVQFGCGYHVSGKADTMPKGIKVIAIPAFATLSTRYRLIDLLPQELSREFNARTRFTAVSDPDEADAILHGNILATNVGATVYDPFSGKATAVQVSVNVSITLTERATGKVLYYQPNLGFRQNYNIATDPHQFFDESSPALERLGQELAHDVVSSIVENF